jgi:hypothetical protein
MRKTTLQVDEKVLRGDVVAGLPCHISLVFNTEWRRQAAPKSFFHCLLKFKGYAW